MPTYPRPQPNGQPHPIPPPMLVGDDESLTELERALLTEVRASQTATHRVLVDVREELKAIRAQAPSRALMAVVVMLWTSMLLVQLASAAERGLDVGALARAVRLLVGGE